MNRPPNILTRAFVLAALIAGPAAAQTAPTPPAPPAAHGAGMPGHHGSQGRMGNMRQRMFPSMSEAGRAVVHEEMMAGGDRRENRQKLAAAREKMLAALSADRYDPAAVKRAMDDERALSDASRQQRQSAMLAAFQKLSADDRKAFAADSRAMKERMGKRVDGWRERMRGRRGPPMDGPPMRPNADELLD